MHLVTVVLFAFSAILQIASANVLNNRIVGGTNSTLTLYVAQVSGYDNWTGGGGVHGGGSFITYSHILTSARLIHNKGYWRFQYGEEVMVNLYSGNATAVHHPDYDPETYENDIGVLFIDSHVYEVRITRVSLPQTLNTPLPQEVGRVTAFPIALLTENRALQTATFKRMFDINCQLLLGSLKASQFCASDAEASICDGDIGSGFVLTGEDGKTNTLVGIVSDFPTSCDATVPAVYTKVALYTDWINEQLAIDHH